MFKEDTRAGKDSDEKRGIWRVVSSTTVYASGFFSRSNQHEVASHLSISLGSPSSTLSKRSVYSALSTRGLEYGETYKCILEAALFSNLQGLALCGDLNEENIEVNESYKLPPHIVDAGIQFLAFLGHHLFPASSLFLPVGIKQVDVLDLFPSSSLHVYAVITDTYETMFTGDIFFGIFEDQDRTRFRVCLRLSEVSIRSLVNPSLRKNNEDTSLYTLNWAPKGETGEREFVTSSVKILMDTLEEVKNSATVMDLKLRSEYLDYYQNVLPRLNHLCSLYALRATRQLLTGAWTKGKRFSLDDCLGPNTQPHMKKQALRLLAILEEDGYLIRSIDLWTIAVENSENLEANIADLWEKLVDDHRSAAGDRTVLSICGDKLAEMITGKANPLYVLFGSDSVQGEVENMYHRSMIFRIYHSVMASVVSTLLDSMKQNRAALRRTEGTKLRVLEVGGGTGATTKHLLPLFQEISKLGVSVEYHFSDVSKSFLVEARKKFSQFDFVAYDIFDLEKGLAEQSMSLA